MRRRPQRIDPTPALARALTPQALGKPVERGGARAREAQRATERGDALSPFYRSGCIVFYPAVDYGQHFSPKFPPYPEDAIQFIASLYVPQGNVGFIKQLHVAPYFGQWREIGQQPEGVQGPFAPPGALNQAIEEGTWENPCAWEGLDWIDPLNPTPGAFTWQWQLRFLPGRVIDTRNAMNLDFNDPFELLYLLEGPPVPTLRYLDSNGRLNLPGFAPGDWPFNEVPRDASTADTLHVPIPPNHTAMVWARWTQQPIAIVPPGEESPADTYLIGPSFARLTGFTMPDDCDAAKRLVSTGWGG